MCDSQKIRLEAEKYYREGDYYCSEAVLKAVLNGFSKKIPHEIIAMASGFPVGIGGAECTCGALSGGVMAIGFFFGRSNAKGSEVAKAMRLSGELHDKFKSLNKCTCCRTLTKGMKKGSPEHMSQCVRFTGEMAEETAKIIKENLFDH